MTIRFSIWRDQRGTFDKWRSDIERVIINDALGAAYRGWWDYTVNGPIDQICSFFHQLGDEGYKIHVFKDNPLEN